MAAYDSSRTTPDAQNSQNELENDENTPLLRKINSKSNNDETVVENDDVEAAQCLSPLLDKQPRVEISRNIGGVISILLLGVFVANADSSLVLATSGTISSEFHDLGDAGWLISSYTLAMCAAQSLYGQLSDIYGRKNTILMSYMFFAVGSFICGAGQSLPQVIFGRLVAGVGGAGINCLVSIVIADMVPIREVASWRSYVNIAATTGRSLGGPIGGYLIDTIGWRWSFLGQAPPTILAAVLVAWKLQPSYCQEDSKRPIAMVETPAHRLPRGDSPISLDRLRSPRTRTWRKTNAFYTSNHSVPPRIVACHRKPLPPGGGFLGKGTNLSSPVDVES